MSIPPQPNPLPNTELRSLEQEIEDSIAKPNLKKIFSKAQEKRQPLPKKVANSYNFSLWTEDQPKFRHEHVNSPVKILHNINDKVKKLPPYIRQDFETFKRVYEHFQNIAYNFE